MRVCEVLFSPKYWFLDGRSKSGVVLIAFLLVLFAPLSALGRVWTDIKGRELRGATLVSHDEKEVVFNLVGGKEYRMPKARLSEKDRKYLASGEIPPGAEGDFNWDAPWPIMVELKAKPAVTMVMEDKED